jgi:hypothetical protein
MGITQGLPIGLPGKSTGRSLTGRQRINKKTDRQIASKSPRQSVGYESKFISPFKVLSFNYSRRGRLGHQALP